MALAGMRMNLSSVVDLNTANPVHAQDRRLGIRVCGSSRQYDCELRKCYSLDTMHVVDIMIELVLFLVYVQLA